MRKAIWQYVRDETAPRWKEIVRGEELWIALALGIGCFCWGQRAPFGNVKGSDLVVLVFAYAAIVLGFSLAGMTLALTLPNKTFAERLVQEDICRKNMYSDLLPDGHPKSPTCGRLKIPHPAA